MILIEKTTPIHASQIRPHWYDSEEENIGSEYDTESECGGGDTYEGWTGEDVWYFIEDYLSCKFVCQDDEYLEDGKMVLGTCNIYLNDEIIVECTLDIAGYYKYDALYTKHFGLLNQHFEQRVPYDIMKVYSVPVKINNYEFIQKRAIIKTYWLRLVQRHWKNRVVSNSGNQRLRGLLSCYSKQK